MNQQFAIAVFPRQAMGLGLDPVRVDYNYKFLLFLAQPKFAVSFHVPDKKLYNVLYRVLLKPWALKRPVWVHWSLGICWPRKVCSDLGRGWLELPHCAWLCWAPGFKKSVLSHEFSHQHQLLCLSKKLLKKGLKLQGTFSTHRLRSAVMQQWYLLLIGKLRYWMKWVSQAS